MNLLNEKRKSHNSIFPPESSWRLFQLLSLLEAASFRHFENQVRHLCYNYKGFKLSLHSIYFWLMIVSSFRFLNFWHSNCFNMCDMKLLLLMVRHIFYIHKHIPSYCWYCYSIMFYFPFYHWMSTFTETYFHSSKYSIQWFIKEFQTKKIQKVRWYSSYLIWYGR